MYKKNAYSHIGMMASGLGLMPMLQIIRYSMHSSDDHTVVSLIYTNKKGVLHNFVIAINNY